MLGPSLHSFIHQCHKQRRPEPWHAGAINAFIHPSMHSSIHQCTHPSINSSMHQVMCFLLFFIFDFLSSEAVTAANLEIQKCRFSTPFPKIGESVAAVFRPHSEKSTIRHATSMLCHCCCNEQQACCVTVAAAYTIIWSYGGGTLP